MTSRPLSSVPLIVYSNLDPEARFGLPTGHGTTPSSLACFLLTTILGAAAYGIAYGFRSEEWGAIAWTYMTGFGRIPIPIILLSIWSLVFLGLKLLKIRAQRAALHIAFVPEDPAFVLTESTADAVIDAIDRASDDPSRFIFLARCRAVLRMMRNLGRVSDVDDILASRGDQDESSMDSGYTILRGFIWAIPVLGFIGTVVGLTLAMKRFGDTMKAAGKDVAEITDKLKTVLEGLDTAFITTAEALIAVLFIYLLQTMVRRADEQLFDDIRSACSNAIVARVRISKREV
ncbi:MAG: MotA/TolQ/ExbB proton channel family protein [Phycisphaerales bacterium]|nr:MotA/TolQ/ExbB proton channel family protein [Phycisphaerales bacterium]